MVLAACVVVPRSGRDGECPLASTSSRRRDRDLSGLGSCRHRGGDLRSRINRVAGCFDSAERDFNCTNETRSCDCDLRADWPTNRREAGNDRKDFENPAARS
jgi:hypothetical protein